MTSLNETIKLLSLESLMKLDSQDMGDSNAFDCMAKKIEKRIIKEMRRKRPNKPSESKRGLSFRLI